MIPFIAQANNQNDSESEEMEEDSEDIESMADFPLDQKVTSRLMRIPDLCYLIFDLCDDNSLVRLSMICTFNHRQLIS